MNKDEIKNGIAGADSLAGLTLPMANDFDDLYNYARKNGLHAVGAVLRKYVTEGEPIDWMPGFTSRAMCRCASMGVEGTDKDVVPPTYTMTKYGSALYCHMWGGDELPQEPNGQALPAVRIAPTGRNGQADTKMRPLPPHPPNDSGEPLNTNFMSDTLELLPAPDDSVNTVGSPIDWKARYDKLTEFIGAMESAASILREQHRKTAHCEHPNTCGGCHFWTGAEAACHDLRVGDKATLKKALTTTDHAEDMLGMVSQNASHQATASETHG